MISSHLYLVDLTGSERVNKINAKLMRLEETKKNRLFSFSFRKKVFKV